MKIYIFLFFALIAPVCAQDFSIKNLDMPIYSQSGVLEQRLKSVSASGSILRPTLKSGVIEFYRAIGSAFVAGATLRFDGATYDHATEIVEGDGRIRFTSEQGDIEGVGFRYDIKTQILTLKSQVIAHFEDAEIVGQTAEAVVRKQSGNQGWTIEEALVFGGVVITDFKRGKLQVDRAESDKAKYLRKHGLIVLSSPVKAWRDGKKCEISGSEDIKIPISQKPASLSE